MINIEVFINDVILKWEGFISNHPNDYGGLTIYGIAKNFHPNWVGFKIYEQNINNLLKVKPLLKQLAIKFYIENYFSPLKELYQSHPLSALFLFDWNINAGNVSIKKLQEILGVVKDGVIGEKTLKKASEFSDLKLLSLLIIKRIEFYKNIVLNDKSQEVFLIGWLNRTIYAGLYLLKLSKF